MSRNRLWLGGGTRGHYQLVRFEIASGIEVKGNEGSGRLKRLGVHVTHSGYDGLGIGSAFHLKALRIQIERYARFSGTDGKLRVEHLVDLFQARIGRMSMRIAARSHEGEKNKQAKASERWDGKNASVFHQGPGSVHDLEAIFFDDRVGENFFGNVLELFLRFVAAPAIEIQNEKLSLADIAHGGVAETREGVLNGFTLRIEHGAFWHNPDVCFHAVSITLPLGPSSAGLFGCGVKGVFETHLDESSQFVFLQAHA